MADRIEDGLMDETKGLGEKDSLLFNLHSPAYTYVFSTMYR